MAWVKLDDQFADHPKVLAAGPLASWLYVCSLTYSARLLTDGFIPAGQVRRLADVDNAGELAKKLVEVGLWDITEGGYRVHDYLLYNPTAETIKARQEADRQRKNGNKDNSARNPDGIQMESKRPVPDPRPVSRNPDPDPRNIAPSASAASAASAAPPRSVPDVKTKKTTKATPEATRPRAADPYWDALVDYLGHGPSPAKRGAWNVAIRDIKAMDGTPEEIPKRFDVYKTKFANCPLTPNALAGLWHDCKPPDHAPPKKPEEMTYDDLQRARDARAAADAALATERQAHIAHINEKYPISFKDGT